MKTLGSLISSWTTVPALLVALWWFTFHAPRPSADVPSAAPRTAAAAMAQPAARALSARAGGHYQVNPAPLVVRPVAGAAAASSTSAGLVSAGALTFDALVLYDTSASNYMFDRSVKVGDVTGDGRDDIVVLAQPGANAPNSYVVTVRLFRQTASGDFLPPIELKATSTNPYRAVELGDLNRDGALDILMALSQNVVTFIYQPDGTFLYNVANSRSEPYALKLMDVDRDGNQDVVTRGWVYYGDGRGGMPRGQQLLSIADGGDFSVGDVTGDGLPDVIASDAGDMEMTVVPHGEITGYGHGRGYPYGAAPYGVTPAAIADFNGDGRADIAFAVGREPTPVISMRYQDPTSTLGPARDTELPSVATTLVSGDVDGNGFADLISLYGSPAPNHLGIMLQGGSGFSPMAQVNGLEPTFTYFSDVAIGQLSPDSCQDIVLLANNRVILLRRADCIKGPPMAICKTQSAVVATASALAASPLPASGLVRDLQERGQKRRIGVTDVTIAR